MIRYLYAAINCSETGTAFRERSARKTVSFEEKVMSNQRTNIQAYFPRKIEAVGVENHFIMLKMLTFYENRLSRGENQPCEVKIQNSKLWEYHLGYIQGYSPDLTGTYSE